MPRTTRRRRLGLILPTIILASAALGAPALAVAATPGATSAATPVATADLATNVAMTGGKHGGDDDEDNTKKVVVCKYVTAPPGVAHHVIAPSVNSLNAEGHGSFDGTFPNFAFADGQLSVVVRHLKHGENPGKVTVPLDCPTLAFVPELDVIDACGAGNAVYGDIPSSPAYTVTRNEDGSVTFTANWPSYFFAAPDALERTLSAPEEKNVEDCPPVQTIVVPERKVLDLCGEGNASWVAPESTDAYSVSEDGRTLTAKEGYEFEGGETTFTFPAGAPEETNTAPCPAPDPQQRVVLCAYPSADAEALAAAAEVNGELRIISLEDLMAAASDFAGSFPFDYQASGENVRVLRFAAVGETADGLADTVSCGTSPDDVETPETPEEETPTDDETDVEEVAGVSESRSDDDSSDDSAESASSGLPNTGGPSGLLLPLGLALVASGAVLMVVRRRITA